MALTTSAVMIASPMPMTACQPTIAANTLPISISAVPPTAKSNVNAVAATGTETNAPTAAAIGTNSIRFGSTTCARRKTPYPTKAPIRAIRVMFVPRAVMPPSAKISACTKRTTLMHSAPVQGPTSTAARAPPSRWPLVPAPTGKLIICPANTNAATRPAIGAVRSSSSSRDFSRATPMPTAATTPVAIDVGASKNPLGTCMGELRPEAMRLDGVRTTSTLLQLTCKNEPVPK